VAKNTIGTHHECFNEDQTASGVEAMMRILGKPVMTWPMVMGGLN
jgi:hypothetical protein